MSFTTGRGKEAEPYFNTTGRFLFVESTFKTVLNFHPAGTKEIGIEYSLLISNGN